MRGLNLAEMRRKTIALRRLEAEGVPHRVTEYDDSGAFHSGEEAAALVGAPPERVYKTLVVVPDAPATVRAMLVMLPVDRQLDLKRLAQVLGEKKLRMATQKEAERVTGMQVGGISALALQKPGLTVLLEESARKHDRIHVSAGTRGVDVELPVADLLRLTDARYVSLEGE